VKTKIYLDTSIPSAPFDATKLLRNHITTQWFLNNALGYDIYISSLMIDELNEWTNQEKQKGAKRLLEKANVNILIINEKMITLSEIYMKKGAIPPTEKNDALHLACAAISEIPYFISWDFSHIVSVNPILKIREIHQKFKLPPLKIGTLALVGGEQYGIFEPNKSKEEKWKIDYFKNEIGS
jgi:predicted nucleic acid-binding protein